MAMLMERRDAIEEDTRLSLRGFKTSDEKSNSKKLHGLQNM